MKKFKVFIYLISLIVLASCLPQEKTAQCSSGEAFDATKRKCVSTLSVSSASISSITPATSYTISSSDSSRTHALTVSDPSSEGYSVKWNVIDPNGNTTLLGTGLSLTFNHTSFTPGVYILEVQLLETSGITVLDSRSWSINIIDKQTPSITQITSTPFSTTITSAATTINATLSNPDLIANVNYEWAVNGSSITTGSFSTSNRSESFSFDPTSAASYHTGANVYTVQLTLKENITGVVYSSASWIISNSIPGFAVPILGSMTLYPGNDTPNSGSIITVIDKTNIPTGGFLSDLDGDGDIEVTEKVDFCVQISNTTASDDTLGIDGDGVFIDFLSNGIVVASTQFSAELTSQCLGILNPTFFQSIPSTIETESQNISAVIYDKFTGNSGRTKYKGFTELISFDWQARVRQKNTSPRITIDDQNSTNDANNSTTNKINCSTKTTTTHSTCEVTQGARLPSTPFTEIPFSIGLEIEDDDYDPNTDLTKFRIEYFLDGTLLDGNHPLSDSDCYFDFGEVTGAADYICNISLKPYDSNGPINPTGLNYTVTAKVTDVDSPFVVETKESNTITWRIATINDFNTGLTANSFADAPLADDSVSYIRKGGSNVTIATDQISELDNITFHLSVSDLERDSFTIVAERCTDILNVAAPCSSTTQIATVTYNSSNDTNPKIVPIAHTISQDAIDTVNQAVISNVNTIRYRFLITDNDATNPLSDSVEVDLQIVNKNEDPSFNSANFSPSLPLASSLVAFTGFPMTFDPGNVTDNTLSDGNNLKYQWLINVDANDDGNFTNDAGYVAIPGATSKTLIWSPGQELDFSGQEGIEVKIKLCVGDDGLIDGGIVSKNPEGQNSCPVATLDTSDASHGVGEWDVTVFSNMAKGRSHNSGAGNNSFNSTDLPSGELAVWIDPRSTDPLIKYMVYVNRSREIVVEKMITSSNGTKAGTTQTSTTTDIEFISFPHSTDSNYANNIVSNLSMIGDTTNDFLYIAYMAPIGGTDQVHIRRINIGGGKTGFVHDGKLGFDKSYNGLLTSPSPLISDNSGNINITQDSSTNGLVEFEFTAVPTLGISVVFNGFTIGGLVSLNAGTDFCGTSGIITCTSNSQTASSFADAINNSTNQELQGVTAVNIAGTNIVTLQGMASEDFIETNLGAQDIGEIYINENLNKWVLPYINGNLATPNKNKISLYTGDLNQRLTDSNPASTHLSTTLSSDEVTNDEDANGRIIIATKVEGSGEIAVYELDDFHNIVDGSSDLFSDTNINDIKIAISKETSEFNQSAFITGTNQNGRLAFARVDSSANDFNFTTAIIRADLDPSFAALDGITNYDIIAGSSEYQLLLAAVIDSDSDTNFDEVVMFQITGNSSPVIDCSYDSADTQNTDKCMRLTTLSSTNAFDLKIALAEVLEDVTMGTIGATASENIKDISAVSFHVDDGGGVKTDDALPIMGIINVSPSAFSTDENSNNGQLSAIPYVR